MRQRGSRTTVGGFGRQDHGCLVHHDDGVLAEAVATYLRDGLRLGQRLMYVGARPAVLHGLGDVDALRDAGILEVVATDGLYGGFEPDRLEADYDAAITQALRDGFTGLRTFAEMDVDAPAEELIRWEALADRMMTERPWSALCAYDGRRHAAQVLADVATVHPLELDFADHAAVLALDRVRGDTELTCTRTPFMVRRVAGIVGVEL